MLTLASWHKASWHPTQSGHLKASQELTLYSDHIASVRLRCFKWISSQQSTLVETRFNIFNFLKKHSQDTITSVCTIGYSDQETEIIVCIQWQSPSERELDKKHCGQSGNTTFDNLSVTGLLDVNRLHDSRPQKSMSAIAFTTRSRSCNREIYDGKYENSQHVHRTDRVWVRRIVQETREMHGRMKYVEIWNDWKRCFAFLYSPRIVPSNSTRETCGYEIRHEKKTPEIWEDPKRN